MIPKYQVVYEELKNEISNGRLALGERMPSELQLMEQYGYSRQTVRKALEELANDGFIQKVRGSGSFVRRSAAEVGNYSKTVMFIALFAEHYYFSQYIGGVEKVLKEKGYVLNVRISNNNPEEEANCLTDAMEKGYAGILLIPAQSGYMYSNLYMYRKIKELMIPCITLGGWLAYSGLHCVAVDDFEGGKKAVEYLINKGHREIACIMNNADYSGCMRYAGYLAALKEAGIKEDKNKVMWYQYETSGSFLENEEALIAGVSSATAVFCFNDELALGVIGILQKSGIDVPGDVSVIGYDDSYMCMFGPMKLTSVKQNPQEIGEKAAENLLQLIANPAFEASHTFETEVAERETVRDVAEM